MDNNTGPDRGLGLPQVMPPVADLEPEVPPTNIRPENDVPDALVSIDPASVPLPESNDDFFNEFGDWIADPDESEPQGETSSLETDDSDDSTSTINHDDQLNIQPLEETAPEPEIASEFTPAINAADPSSVDEFLTSVGLGNVDPEYEEILRQYDPQDTLRELSYFFPSEEASGTDLVAPYGEAPLQGGSEGPTGDNTVPSNPVEEAPSVDPLQLSINFDSQPTVVPAHISTQAPVATTWEAAGSISPALAGSQPTTTIDAQLTVMEMPSHPAVSSSDGTGSPVVNFINGSHTVNMYYQGPSYVPPQQPQQLQQVYPVQTNAPVPTAPIQPTAPVQHQPPAQARATVQSRGATLQPQALRKASATPNGTFRSTPLKQSWTSADLKTEEQFNPLATGQSSQVFPSAQSQPSHQVPATTPTSHYDAGPVSPTAPTQAGLANPDPYGLSVIGQPGTPGPMQGYPSLQPQASAQNYAQSFAHSNPLNSLQSVQRTQSCPQLQVNPGPYSTAPTQLGYSASPRGPTPAPAQPYNPTSQQPQSHLVNGAQNQTAPLQQVNSPAPTQGAATAQPGPGIRLLSPAQIQRVVGTPSPSDPQIQPSPRSSAHPNVTIPVTARPSSNGVYTGAQPRATTAPHIHPRAQGYSQVQAYTGDVATHGLGVYQEAWEPDVVKIWMVKGANEGEFYHVEVGRNDVPFRVYPVSPPSSPQPTLPIRIAPPARQPNAPAPQPQMPSQTAFEGQAQYGQSYPQPPQQVNAQPQVNPQPQVNTQPRGQTQSQASTRPQANPRAQVNPQAQANPQAQVKTVAQTPPWPVQRSHSAPSLPITYNTPAPGTPFTVTPPPPTAFKPRIGDDTFSPSFWQHVPSDPSSSTHSPRVLPPAQGYPAYRHTTGPPASAQVSTPSWNQRTSAPNGVSRLTPAPTPTNNGTGRKRRAGDNDDEVQEVPATEYRGSSADPKGKRVKRGRK